MIFIVIVAVVNKTTSPLSLIAVPFLMFAALLAVDLVLWQLVGKDVVSLQDDCISLHQNGRLFRKRYQIPIDKVSLVSNEYGQGDWLLKIWFPSSQGPVRVKGLNETICFGRGADSVECESFIQEFSRKYPHIPVVVPTQKHRLTFNEGLFVVWAILAVTVFIPAWWVVPAWQQHNRKQEQERDSVQLAWIKQNYPKKYCYSTEYGVAFRRIGGALGVKDSLYEREYLQQCHIEDSAAFFSDGPHTRPYILPKEVLYDLTGFAGVVYVVRTRGELSLVYANVRLYEPFWVPNMYLHADRPDCPRSKYVSDSDPWRSLEIKQWEE
ncbi:MAG: hypothetical protein J6Y77_00180 [Paludibacteraceae bacterium]|nr:hypothetical protein [Paludibacteraceae bacterium]